MNGDMQNDMQDNMAPAPESHGAGLKQGIIALVIVAVLVALAFWLFSVVGQSSVNEFEPGKEKVTASEGKAVDNFPRELLLESGVEVLESYSINYEEGAIEQPVVKYRSELDLLDNYRQFRSFFLENGWSIQQDLDPDSTDETVSLSAITQGADVVISFTGKAEGEVVVQIVYLKK